MSNFRILKAVDEPNICTKATRIPSCLCCCVVCAAKAATRLSVTSSTCRPFSTTVMPYKYITTCLASPGLPADLMTSRRSSSCSHRGHFDQPCACTTISSCLVPGHGCQHSQIAPKSCVWPTACWAYPPTPPGFPPSRMPHPPKQGTQQPRPCLQGAQGA